MLNKHQVLLLLMINLTHVYHTKYSSRIGINHTTKITKPEPKMARLSAYNPNFCDSKFN